MSKLLGMRLFNGGMTGLVWEAWNLLHGRGKEREEAGNG
jgi:hypothetical protein